MEAPLTVPSTDRTKKRNRQNNLRTGTVCYLKGTEAVSQEMRCSPNAATWQEYLAARPSTARIIDPLPSSPSRFSSKQRIIKNEGRKSLQPILHITAAVNLRDQPAEASKEKEFPSLNTGGEFQPSKRPAESGANRRIRPIFSMPLSFADFRPFGAPFVPNIVRCMVDVIEQNCYKSSWADLYRKLEEFTPPVEHALKKLLKLANDRKKLQTKLKSMMPTMVISIMRTFLNEFPTKPLHFSSADVKDLVREPLFDHFLRPNPNLQGIVQRASMPRSRTDLDTLAFLMIHILHALEYNPHGLDGKSLLCNVYGPLLISFANRPRLYESSATNALSEEAAILEVVVDVCDARFWNHMSMLKVARAFRYQTYRERQMNKDRKSAAITYHRERKESAGARQSGTEKVESLSSRFGQRSPLDEISSASEVTTFSMVPNGMVSLVDMFAVPIIDALVLSDVDETVKKAIAPRRTTTGKFSSVMEHPAPVGKNGVAARSTSDLLQELYMYRCGRVAGLQPSKYPRTRATSTRSVLTGSRLVPFFMVPLGQQ
ncbi:unnamed protein product [Calicophoron daubneyi]|uniref:Rho-GAP domain-containing protein n=1 Tax=Calicophoron daubneyi TaxID=300641 RepID=A0AAV2TDK9_CALDB